MCTSYAALGQHVAAIVVAQQGHVAVGGPEKSDMPESNASSVKL